MERLNPDWLRTCASLIEDKRQLENVDRCQRYPELDQHMLLALNGAAGKSSKYKDGFPDAGIIMEGLRERLIEVSVPNGCGIALGIFYTNIDPLERNPKVVAGVFPLNADHVEYTIRPIFDQHYYRSYYEKRPSLKLELHQESVTEEDPFLARNPKGLDLLFFKESPFSINHPYQTVLPSDKQRYLRDPELFELSLEDNVIRRALWIASFGGRPNLFRKSGFPSFINSHCSNPRYMELHAAFTQFHRRK